MGCSSSSEADQFGNGVHVDGKSEVIDSSIQMADIHATDASADCVLQQPTAATSQADTLSRLLTFTESCKTKDTLPGPVPPVRVYTKPPMTFCRFFIMSTGATFDVKYPLDQDELYYDTTSDRNPYITPSPPVSHAHTLSQPKHAHAQTTAHTSSKDVTQRPADKAHRDSTKQQQKQEKQLEQLQQQRQKQVEKQEQQQQQRKQQLQQQKQQQKRGTKIPVNAKAVEEDEESQPSVQRNQRVMWPLRCMAGLGQRVQSRHPRQLTCHLLANCPLSSVVC